MAHFFREPDRRQGTSKNVAIWPDPGRIVGVGGMIGSF